MFLVSFLEKEYFLPYSWFWLSLLSLIIHSFSYAPEKSISFLSALAVISYTLYMGDFMYSFFFYWWLTPILASRFLETLAAGVALTWAELGVDPGQSSLHKAPAGLLEILGHLLPWQILGRQVILQPRPPHWTLNACTARLVIPWPLTLCLGWRKYQYISLKKSF